MRPIDRFLMSAVVALAFCMAAGPSAADESSDGSTAAAWVVTDADGQELVRTADRGAAVREFSHAWSARPDSGLRLRMERRWRLGPMADLLPPRTTVAEVPAGLTKFNLDDYHVIDVHPDSARVLNRDALIWADPAAPNDPSRSASAYMWRYVRAHMALEQGYEKPIAVRMLGGDSYGKGQLQLMSRDPDRPALLFSADPKNPAVFHTAFFGHARGTNYVIQGVTTPTDGMFVDGITVKGYKGLFSERTWGDRRVVRRFEGCTWRGGANLRGGTPQFGGFEFFRCRSSGGKQGMFFANGAAYNGEPSLLLEESLVLGAGKSPILDHGMYLSRVNGIRIHRSMIIGSSGAAVKLHACGDVKITDCLIAASRHVLSPNANTKSAGGKSTQDLVFTGNVVTDMQQRQAGFWMGWSLNRARIANNLFVNTVAPGRANGAVFYFAGPAEGTGRNTATADDDAHAMTDLVIENNLAYNYTGAFLSIYTDFYEIAPWSVKIRGNVQGGDDDGLIATATWSPGSWSKKQWLDCREGIEFADDNIWYSQYDEERRPKVPGREAPVKVKDSGMNLARLNAALGGEAEAGAFFEDVFTHDPGVTIDRALAMFREAFKVVEVGPDARREAAGDDAAPDDRPPAGDEPDTPDAPADSE